MPVSTFVFFSLRKWLPLLPIAALVAALLGSCNVAKYPKSVGEDVADQPLIYKDTLDSDKRKDKPKKIPKKTFYGLKTRRAYTKKSTRTPKVQTYELFYVLKTNIDPDPQVPNRAWYHAKKRTLNYGPIPPKEMKYVRIPHGPYKRIENKIVVTEGIFYIGTKHGRWEYVERKQDEILTNKERWYKGWPRDAEIEYYDVEKKRVKEVKPLEEGRYHGDYFRFYPDGVLAEYGKYEFGRKVGVWYEYFDNTKKRVQRVRTQYPATAWDYDTGAQPYKLYEVDEKGTVLYDWDEEQKKKKK